jgi:hypothetical protein
MYLMYSFHSGAEREALQGVVVVDDAFEAAWAEYDATVDDELPLHKKQHL